MHPGLAGGTRLPSRHLPGQLISLLPVLLTSVYVLLQFEVACGNHTAGSL